MCRGYRRAKEGGQWREFNDYNDVPELYDGPCGDELGAMKMLSLRAGCMLLLCVEKEVICGRICQQQSVENLIDISNLLVSVRRYPRETIFHGCRKHKICFSEF